VAGGAARLAARGALLGGVGVSVGAEWGGESWGSVVLGAFAAGR
jgi:hypothetical protein